MTGGGQDFSRRGTIKQEASPSVLREVFRLRAFVWRQLSQDERFSGDEWTDEFDVRALHWVAHVDGRLAGAARLSVHGRLEDIPDFHIFSGLSLSLTAPIASINRLVIHPDFRGMGLSRELDARRLEAARNMKCRTMVVCATRLSGTKRLEAFLKLGFEPLTPLWAVRDFDRHTPMAMNL
jgi:GNAT superfamily N-acetyltransferase